jgi:pimeloyl-ACP methyl ester carboxylesterase
MIVEIGHGPPLVVIPGIQGRWEYVRPAIAALAESFRVFTFSLCGEPNGSPRFDPASGFDSEAERVAALIDERGLDRVVVCGISYGGLPAIRFAATRPERTAALVLVSTPGPVWRLKRKHRVYAKAPWLFGPLFLAESPLRLRREVVTALPDVRSRLAFARWQIGTVARAPLSPSRMAARARLIGQGSIDVDCARVTAPTLVVTGEADLDRVVPVSGTLDYLQRIAGAEHATLERTGHLGSVTRPDRFARCVREFIDRHGQWDPAYACKRASA